MLSTTATAQPVEPPRPEPVAEKRVSAGLGLAMARDRNLAVLVEGQVGYRVYPGYWLHAAFGRGGAMPSDPAGRNHVDGSAYEARVGVGRWTCSGNLCGGLLASVGYHHQTIDFDDGFYEPPLWTAVRDLAFGEIRGVGRLNVVRDRVALEAAFGLRASAALHTERTSSDVDRGFLASLGLRVAM